MNEYRGSEKLEHLAGAVLPPSINHRSDTGKLMNIIPFLFPPYECRRLDRPYPPSGHQSFFH